MRFAIDWYWRGLEWARTDKLIWLSSWTFAKLPWLQNWPICVRDAEGRGFKSRLPDSQEVLSAVYSQSPRPGIESGRVHPRERRKHRSPSRFAAARAASVFA